jgi:5'/3'-nucleotidase SurE
MAYRGKIPVDFVSLDKYLSQVESNEFSERLKNASARFKGRIEFAFIDASPATVCNIGLNHIAPFPIDLVLSGPNVGQNAGSACILASGTVGAALQASNIGVKSISLSFGFTVKTYGQQFAVAASSAAISIIQRLLESWPSEVRLFNVNVPLGATLGTPIHLTRIHCEKAFQRLYRQSSDHQKFQDNHMEFQVYRLIFEQDAASNTDRWALNNGLISVTPLLGMLETVEWHLSPSEWVNLKSSL